jgi:Homeodomain-like domain
MRVAPSIKLTEAERKKLTAIAASPLQPLRIVQRANIILMAERGLENVEIADRLHVGIPLVGRWRRRYAASSFAGIEKRQDTTAR